MGSFVTAVAGALAALFDGAVDRIEEYATEGEAGPGSGTSRRCGFVNVARRRNKA